MNSLLEEWSTDSTPAPTSRFCMDGALKQSLTIFASQVPCQYCVKRVKKNLMKFKGMSRWDRSIASTVYLKGYVLGAREVSPLTTAISSRNVFMCMCPGVWDVLTELFVLELTHREDGLTV